MNKFFATMVAFGQVYLLFPMAARAETTATVPVGLTNAQITLSTVGSTSDLSTASSLPILISRGINVVLGVLGILFLIFVVYAGFLYLTAQGSDEPIKKAKKLLTTAIIGLVLIIAAFAISNYVLGALTAVVTG